MKEWIIETGFSSIVSAANKLGSCLSTVRNAELKDMVMQVKMKLFLLLI